MMDGNVQCTDATMTPSVQSRALCADSAVPLLLQARQVEAQAEPKITRVVPVNYAKASELKMPLEKLLGACVSISVDTRTNTLILTGTPSCLRVWEGTR
jgi:type II secretory pathway component GspD/PulD (secretin)